ncbi:NADH-dependent alcohol dehydrogenase [Pseudoalteromonas sp. NBT06-2]|uniref:iron-containing alcohol dehydrogenase n=1 Tax=Pseudoalteromonas sp. NBT06-2 TaxID=2025950 RepID=UPI000BA57D9C|nr:iron-containing alcohol dehydrogenase [Pseudoalteromonas sp. NBT06-2]PAJ73359.1 NADH-dependent alcohol dehydrogenase [Pseudoalteromonas sp. NBT06-2]
MQNFDYYNPTQIVFGQERLNELDNLVPHNAKVLILFGGGSVKRFGTLDKIKSSLGKREVLEFGGIEANPQFETLMQAVELVQAENIDFLLAVGGGSVMDGTKFVALAANEKSNHNELLFHGFEVVPVEQAIPLGCIVTLPATGSEMNTFGVITYNEQKYPFTSPLAFPKFSLLDPDLTLTLPKEQIANGVADAFIHVIEQYLTQPQNAKIQDRFAEGILKTLIEDGPITYQDKTNIEARKNFMWSATSALNGLIGVGVMQDWTTHMIGHEMTAMFGIAHGRTLAIVLPSLLRERTEQKREKLVQFAERVWDITQGTDDEKITKAIDNTEAFFNSLDIVTKLSHYDIDDKDIETLISNMARMGLTQLSETGDLTLDIVHKILVAAK